ncbi:MAG: hypothetical protein Q9194_004830 [Teloschistes cf. exilis]
MIGTSLDLAAVTHALDDPILATKFDWLSQAFVIGALILGKFSIAFLIMRVSNTTWHKRFLCTVNAILFLTHFPLLVWTYTQCKPTARLWDPRIPGKCQNPKSQLYYALFLGALGAAIDLLFALFPILIIRRLRIPRKQKIQVGCFMGLGIFTEMYVIIVASSLATLRPLLLKLMSVHATIQGRNSKGYQSHTQEQSHQLEAYPKTRSTHESTLPINSQTPARSLEGPIPAEDVDAIRKTVDVTVTEATANTEPKRPGRLDDTDIESGTFGKDIRV